MKPCVLWQMLSCDGPSERERGKLTTLQPFHMTRLLNPPRRTSQRQKRVAQHQSLQEFPGSIAAYSLRRRRPQATRHRLASFCGTLRLHRQPLEEETVRHLAHSLLGDAAILHWVHCFVKSHKHLTRELQIQTWEEVVSDHSLHFGFCLGGERLITHPM